MSTRIVWIAGSVLFCCVFSGPLEPAGGQETAAKTSSRVRNSRSTATKREQLEGQEQQNLRSFRGKVSQKENDFYFEELLHYTPYRLADTWNIKRFVGRPCV